MSVHVSTLKLPRIKLAKRPCPNTQISQISFLQYPRLKKKQLDFLANIGEYHLEIFEVVIDNFDQYLFDTDSMNINRERASVGPYRALTPRKQQNSAS